MPRYDDNDASNNPVAGSMKELAAQLPLGDASVPKRKQKTYPSPQLVDYLGSSSTAGPYTGLEDNKGPSAFCEHMKDMKGRLEAWQKDWDTMS